MSKKVQAFFIFSVIVLTIVLFGTIKETRHQAEAREVLNGYGQEEIVAEDLIDSFEE